MRHDAFVAGDGAAKRERRVDWFLAWLFVRGERSGEGSGGLSAARKELLGVARAELVNDPLLPCALNHSVGQAA